MGLGDKATLRCQMHTNQVAYLFHPSLHCCRSGLVAWCTIHLQAPVVCWWPVLTLEAMFLALTSTGRWCMVGGAAQELEHSKSTEVGLNIPSSSFRLRIHDHIMLKNVFHDPFHFAINLYASLDSEQQYYKLKYSTCPIEY